MAKTVRIHERDQAQALRKDEARKKIAAGVASLRAGESVDGDAFMAAMDAELAELENASPPNAIGSRHRS